MTFEGNEMNFKECETKIFEIEKRSGVHIHREVWKELSLGASFLSKSKNALERYNKAKVSDSHIYQNNS